MLITQEENLKKPHFDPLISSLGMKINVNIVNITKTPLYFQSRHDLHTNSIRCGALCC